MPFTGERREPVRETHVSIAQQQLKCYERTEDPMVGPDKARNSPGLMFVGALPIVGDRIIYHRRICGVELTKYVRPHDL